MECRGRGVTTPFIIYSLPRSRSFWLSRYLSYGAWHCGHDEIRYTRSIDDVRSWFGQDFTGTAETAAAPWWRMVQRIRPDIRTVVVRRPVPEVIDSLARLSLVFDRPAVMAKLRYLDRKLDQIERRVSNVMSVTFDELREEKTCGAVFERCLGIERNPEWWATMAPLNIQINMSAMLRYCVAYKAPMEKLSLIAKQFEFSAMARDTKPIDGLTIQQESFDTFFRDGHPLFRAHLAEVGEPPDAFWSKNLPLMQALYQHGAMQITTARCNGRMFGYLMAVISPSMENAAVTTAIHTTFYASPLFPGLGLKLQRASLQALRDRGIDEAYWHSGVRGSGPRMDVIYRRLGASDFGRLYTLKLKDCA